jgi:hypothetical protein
MYPPTAITSAVTDAATIMVKDFIPECAAASGAVPVVRATPEAGAILVVGVVLGAPSGVEVFTSPAFFCNDST